MKTRPTHDALRGIIERLESASYDLETALGLAIRSGAMPVHRDDITMAADSIHAARRAALAELAEIETAARKAAVRAYRMELVTSPA